ncbi:MAG: hypothetical protein DRQ88_12140 [Epsilonproteobacteria bacterium]|nr:MAG: hypothetical protein DRQ88_12140 [Campylobacterota bacterium]
MRIAYLSDGLVSRPSLNLLKKLGEVSFVQHLASYKKIQNVKPIDLVIIELENIDEILWESLEFFKVRNIFVMILGDQLSMENIEKCYLLGCHDIFTPPLKPEYLKYFWGKYFSKEFIFSKFNYVTRDTSFWKKLRKINQLFIDPGPILLKGPTGVGKTHLARMIHEYLLGKDKPFIPFNCSEFSDSLIESELFGHKKGSFTGAITDKLGLLSLADRGTLFIDEIGTMPLTMQKKLLKALEEKSFYPVGAGKSEKSNFQLISATCDDILDHKSFRSDLYYRLEGFVLNIKPLKERPYDIPLLFNEFLKKLPRKIIITPETMHLLKKYNWPGNVRELKNLIRLIGSTDGGVVAEKDLPEKIQKFFKEKQNQISFLSNDAVKDLISDVGLNMVVENFEDQAFKYFLVKNDGKVRKTMNELRISNNTFYRIKNRAH